jgi:hypothetical protein
MTYDPVVVSAAVEGIVDDAVVRRLLADAAATVGAIHIAHGKAHLKDKVNGYNHAAARYPWVVVVDLDHDADCAPILCRSWLSVPSRFMCFRVAVRAVEAWLLADRQRVAQFLDVSFAKVPQTPDAIDDPKRAMVDLARRSRRKEIREDMVPLPGSGRSEGAAYASRLIEFSHRLWRPAVAEKHSNSLRRCRRGLRAILSSFAANDSAQK